MVHSVISAMKKTKLFFFFLKEGHLGLSENENFELRSNNKEETPISEQV